MKIGPNRAMIVKGRLTQVGPLFQTKKGSPWVAVFKCECGRHWVCVACEVENSHTRSCGCLASSMTSERNKTHGMSRTPTHNSWRGMLERCTKPNHASYSRYGGVGIRVCDRWSLFENFLQDMGVRPVGTTLDRVDSYGPYEPSNCRWASSKEQARNQKSNRQVTVRGVTKPLAEWVDAVDEIEYEKIRKRLNRGWSPEDAIFGNKKT